MPDQVRSALILLYGSLVLGVVRSIIEYPRLVEMAASAGGSTYVISLQIFSFLLVGWIIFKISRRKHWARATFAILGAIGLPFSIPVLIEAFDTSPISGGLGVAQAMAQVMAVVMLYMKDGRAWFRGEPTPPAPAA